VTVNAKNITTTEQRSGFQYAEKKKSHWYSMHKMSEIYKRIQATLKRRKHQRSVEGFSPLPELKLVASTARSSFTGTLAEPIQETRENVAPDVKEHLTI
jgi:hypothetical protein